MKKLFLIFAIAIMSSCGFNARQIILPENPQISNVFRCSAAARPFCVLYRPHVPTPVNAIMHHQMPFPADTVSIVFSPISISRILIILYMSSRCDEVQHNPPDQL